MKALHVKYLWIAAAALVVSLALAACQDDDGGDTPVTLWRYDFVTYMGYSGGTATFQYLGRGDSTAITLHATGLDEPTKIKPGQRVLLYYTIASTASDGSRNVEARYYTYSNVATDTLRLNTRPVADYAMHPLRLRSMWRSGGYINLRCEVEYTGKARQLYLMADRATLDHDTIDCYLVHDLMQAGDTTYFWRNCYGSFYVGRALERPACRALKVHVADAVRPSVTSYTFAK